MCYIGKVIICSSLLIIFGIQIAFAYGGDLSISNSSVRLYPQNYLEGNSVRIYATVYNSSPNDLLGTVQFYDETAGKQIGSDQTISVFSNKTDDIFVDWIPWFEGNHTISITIDPWILDGDDPSNNTALKTVSVLKDSDYDGITDSEDTDDDNDGITDEEDMFPENSSEWADTDGDRIGDNTDDDDDNDGKPDAEDIFPLNSLEWEDTDSDGTGNNADDDDDNDGLKDEDEITIGTDPNKADTDEDSVIDSEDAFPLDASEQYDFDNDGIGDGTDEDDDNDGILDIDDVNDHNKGPVIVIRGNKKIAFLHREYILSADDSYDEDGEIKEIQWIIDEKEAKLGKILSYNFDSLGLHSIKIIAVDDKDEIREKELNINVYNLDLYMKITLGTIIIFLAIIIFLKYSSLAKKISKQLINRK